MRIAEVKRLVAQFYGVSREMMDCQQRNRRLAWPRQVAMDLARRYGRNSTTRIGAAFGGRDHTTVINASARVRHQSRIPIHAADLALLCGQLEAGAISQKSAWVEQLTTRQRNVAQERLKAERLPDLAAEREFRRRIHNVRIAEHGRPLFAQPVQIPPLAVLVSGCAV